MVVVIAIVILLTGLVVPAATQMWRDRKIADAQNLISGMLLTARARALQSGGAETGLFFFVDEQGVQRVVPITQNHNDPAQADPNKVIRGWESDGRWFNVFTVIRDRGFTLPAPMRVAPLYTICEEDDDDAVGICANRIDHQLFSDEELGVLSIGDLAIGDEADTAQAHRNFFTLIFSPAGELMVGRDALIRDIDDEGEAEGENEGEGVVCGLSVQGSSADSSGAVTRYYAADEDSSEVELNGQGASLHPTWLVVDSDDVAMNFPSVDGLLVYDDSLFNEAGTPQDKRTLLRSTGLPFYINRLTGAVVRGPVGEAGEMVASTP
jgi:type II secretory pathway pseudopilin PulG